MTGEWIRWRSIDLRGDSAWHLIDPTKGDEYREKTACGKYVGVMGEDGPPKTDQRICRTCQQVSERDDR